jgi:hypothetical protein
MLGNCTGTHAGNGRADGQGNGHDRGYRFAIICPGYLIGKKLPTAAWEIYSAIAERRIPRTDRTRPTSNRDIADRVNLDRRNVPRYLSQLKKVGAIEVLLLGTGPGARSVYRVVGTPATDIRPDVGSTPERPKHPVRPVETRTTDINSDVGTDINSEDRTDIKPDVSKKKGKREGRSPRKESVFIKTGRSSGRAAPLGEPRPPENVLKLADRDAAKKAKVTAIKRDQRIQKNCRYVNATYDGDERERRLAGLSSTDDAVAQRWLNDIDLERLARGWDDKQRRVR